ncbi:MAG: translation initiation factor IF-2 [Planctomycetaceae bacterium]|nr:translation initiation factor IF-2 [Planctomycetaceae bacterium]
MAIRIYTFAKDLGLDNKALLDICEKLGVHGKGSALASLSDEEIAKIKKYLEGSAEKASPPAAAAPTATASAPRPLAPLERMRANDRPKVLDRPKRPIGRGTGERSDSPSEPESNVPEVVREAVEPIAIENPVATVDSPVVPAAVTPEVVVPKPPVPRMNPLGNRRGPIRNLDKRPKRDDEVESDTRREDAKPERSKLPNVRLASMPKVKQPTPTVQQPQEKVVKPDMTLPQEAIARVKQRGNAALPLAHFTESASKKPKKPPGAGSQPNSGPAAPPVLDLGTSLDRRKKSKGKGDSEVADSEAGMGSIRQKREKRVDRKVVDSRFSDDDSPLRIRRKKGRASSSVNTAAPRKERPVLELPCTVRSFSETAGVSAGQVLKVLMMDLGLGGGVNINATLDDEVVELLVTALELDIEIHRPQSLEEETLGELEIVDNDEDLETRPPIVTFLGHVDHGKTSLLDALIGINVVSGEAGGITQHIRAYTVDREGRRISFVDTPGHEAFTEMRARGANVTDIAVLVVAADDGVMPQTEEAISHAKAAGVPIIVAMNKIDLPGANPDRVLQQLAAHELMPSQWGGEVEVVQTSAITGVGLDDLLETILTTAELYEFKANPNRAAVGTCLESQQDQDRGVVAKVVVQNGTLRVGDIVLCGCSFGRVKAMYDTLKPNQRVESAGPSVPVNITGLDRVPDAGEKLWVVDDITKARSIAEQRESYLRDQSLSGITKRVSLVEFQQRMEAGDLAGAQKDVVTLNLILRADTRGSIEAIRKELGKLEHPEVRIRILQALVGGITVGDIRLAQASDAVVIGFSVVPDENARALAEDLQVEIRRYDIIYKVADDIKATLEGKLKPEEQNVDLGALLVLKTFTVSRMGTIAGCRVMRGSIQRGSRIRVIRDNRIVGDYAMESLRREKDDVKEVNKGMECGVKLAGFNDVKEGDMLEAYRIEEVARTL